MWRLNLSNRTIFRSIMFILAVSYLSDATMRAYSNKEGNIVELWKNYLSDVSPEARAYRFAFYQQSSSAEANSKHISLKLYSALIRHYWALLHTLVLVMACYVVVSTTAFRLTIFDHVQSNKVVRLRHKNLY